MGLTVVLDAGAACGGNVMPESRFPGRQIGLRTVSNRASSPAPAPVVIGANLAGHYPGFRFWTPGSCSVYTQPPSPASPGWRRGRRRGISHTLKRRAYVRGRKPGDRRMRPRGRVTGSEGTPVFGEGGARLGTHSSVPRFKGNTVHIRVASRRFPDGRLGSLTCQKSGIATSRSCCRQLP